MIFESVIEELEIKDAIHKRINAVMKDTAIAATGTSGLSIEEMAKCYSEENRKRFCGIHFFNPPYNLNLCEIILNTSNSNEFVKELSKYLKEKLLRNVVVVKDEPGFLANNIGFQFINMAMQYANNYKEKGGIDYIDSIISGITGRSMSPMRTADFVGLDVHKAIIGNIYSKQKEDKEYFENVDYVDYLLEIGNKGDKTEKGLYDLKNKEVFDINKKEYRPIRKYKFEYIDEAYKEIKNGNYKEAYQTIVNNECIENKILMEMMLKYVVYALKTSLNVAENIKDCDIAMAEGFNWIPPLAFIELIGGKQNLLTYIEKYLKNDNIVKEINLNDVLQKDLKSNYNYKKYIKGML